MLYSKGEKHLDGLYVIIAGQRQNHLQPNFSKGAETYEQVAWAQKQGAKILVDTLLSQAPALSPKSILDIGTGTGYVAEYLLSHFPNSSYTLNDIAPHMLDKAYQKLQHHANIRFHLGDAESSSFLPHDLVISNFAFQWFANLEHTLTVFWQRTKTLAFSTLLDGTFAEWWQLCDRYGSTSQPRPTYPKYAELEGMCRLLKPQQIYFSEHVIELQMNSPLAFAKYVRRLGANLASSNCCHELLPLFRRHHDSFTTKYRVFYAILRG